MARNDLQLRQFLRSLEHSLRADTPLAESERALDKWTIIACQALYHERYDLVELAIKLLYDAYAALPAAGVELTEKRLAVVIRWDTIRSIVHRPAKAHPMDTNYLHSSWIRQGHVEAARAGLTGRDDGSANLISVSRRLLVANPSMRPDLPDALVPSAGNIGDNDTLLNALCQFDILYCLLVAAEGQTSVRSFYPSSAAFNETRAVPILVTVAGDSEVRAALFPDSTDAMVAEAIYEVVRLARQESFKFGGSWWGPPPNVQAFLSSIGQQEA